MNLKSLVSKYRTKYIILENTYNILKENNCPKDYYYISVKNEISILRKIIDDLSKFIIIFNDRALEIIGDAVNKYFNTNIYLDTRKEEIREPRQIAMYFACRRTKKSLAVIGSHYAGRDHATVLNAKKRINNLMETDKKFKNMIDDIENKLTN